MTAASRALGLGALPGRRLDDATGIIAAGGRWHVPQLPERGVLDDAAVRTVALLDGVHADLGPRGWVLSARPQRASWDARDRLARDLDWLEANWAGVPWLKTQLLGPWSLACELELPNGHRALTDRGAVRDLTEALAGAAAAHAADLVARFGLAQEALAVQFDEPWLADVVAGRVPGTHRFDEIRAVPAEIARAGLATVTDAARATGDEDRPREVLLNATGQDLGAAGDDSAAWDFPGTLLLDPQRLDPAGLDVLGARLDAGSRTGVRGASARDVVNLLSRLGLRESAGLVDVVAAPAEDPGAARAAYERAASAAKSLN